MRRMKYVMVLLAALSLLVWTVQPAMACGTSSADGGGTPGYGIGTKLVFIHQPSDTVMGTSINPAITVAVQDCHGNTVTCPNLVITVAIGNNPSGGKLAGIGHVNAVKGVATFANLSIDKPGKGYTLKATAGWEIAATSNSFNVTAVITTTTMTTTPVVTTTATTTMTTTPVVTTTATTTTKPVAKTTSVTTTQTPVLMQIRVVGLIPTPSPVLIDQDGYIHGNYELKSNDGTVTLALPNFNGCWDSEGNALTGIVGGNTIAQPEISGGYAVVMAYTFGPDGANFNPALSLTLKYDTAVSEANVLENSLYAEGWDGTQWQLVSGAINKAQKTITIQISHFSTYAVIGKVLSSSSAAAVASGTDTMNQPVSFLTPVPDTNPSSSSLEATINSITTQAGSNIPAINAQSSHTSIGLILAGIAVGIALILLLIVLIMRRRAERE